MLRIRFHIVKVIDRVMVRRGDEIVQYIASQLVLAKPKSSPDFKVTRKNDMKPNPLYHLMLLPSLLAGATASPDSSLSPNTL